MATSLNWPSSLPCFRLSPYRVAPRDPVMQTDFGITTRRRQIYSDYEEEVVVEALLDEAQEQDFRNFYDVTLSMGTQWFNVPLRINGSVQTREAMFINPRYVLDAIESDTHMRLSATLLTRESATEPEYELTGTEYVNTQATLFADSGTLPAAPGGTVVTINVAASDKIRILKPSVAADALMFWDGWSPYDEDDNTPPGDGLTWVNNFIVSDQDDNLLLHYQSGRVATEALALAALQADVPIELTGRTAYQFWYFDTPTGDNRQGLSLKIEVYSLVSS